MKTRDTATVAQPVTMPLRTLNDEEMQQAYEEAHHAKKLHQPLFLRAAWAQKKEMVGPAGVKDLVRILRVGAASPVMDDPETAAAYLAILLRMMVERFEVLVQTGSMDEVLPRLTALPVLYSMKAGKGAPEWKWARDMFEGKKVGTDALSGHRGSDYEAARDANWGLLAVEAVRVACFAAIKLPEYNMLKAQAVAVGYKVAKRPGAHYAWRGSLYVLSDGGVLVWPDWLPLCQELPRTVKEDVPRYKDACRAILKEFFGDPGNTWAELLLEPKITSKNPITRSRARLEAVEAIVSAVARLGGWKR